MPDHPDRRIAYTPLSRSPTELANCRGHIGLSEEELCCETDPQSTKHTRDDSEDDLDDQEDDAQGDESTRIFGDPSSGKALLDSIGLARYGTLELRQLRAILYLASGLLLIVFILQLFNSLDRDLSSHTLHLPKSNVVAHENQLPDEQTPPRYDSYLSSILSERNQRGIANLSLADDLAAPDQILQNKSWWQLGQAKSGQYATLSNYIRAMKSFNYNSSVTLTTQATTEFMYHTLELCKRWDGPLSIAVFTPGAELTIALTLVKFMRLCLPAPLSACIRDKVTWHLVYNRAHGPPANTLSYPFSHLDLQNYPLFVQQDLCPKFAGPEPEDMIRQFEVDLKKRNDLFPNNYRQQFQLTYPINALRNTARLAAKTKYLLASDIELYPSKNLVSAFTNYITNHNPVEELSLPSNKFIFTLPIFEVKSNLSAPKTKEELVDMVRREDAIFFHKWVCDACQNFPNRLNWLQDDTSTDDLELKIFGVTQRDKTRSFWEPIFIGTNQEPLYDDRLSWDGRRDKMGQMYEMCLQNYRLLIIANAFLVHTPGIKHIDKNDTIKRLKYLRENNAIYDKTMARLRQTYSNASNIDVC